MIKTYINELSIDEQHHSITEFEDALNSLCSCLFRLSASRLKVPTLLYYTRQLLCRASGPGTPFTRHLNQVGRSIRTRFLALVMNGAIEWEDMRLHDGNDLYEWEDEIVTDTSVGEASEDELRSDDASVVMLSFEKSRFSGLVEALVQKNSAEDILVRNCDTPASVDEFLELLLDLERLSYSPDAKVPPIDFQTVLRDRDRFAPVPNRFVKGRLVYHNAETGGFWHADSRHFGRSAHLEVYTPDRKHAGKATLEGEMIAGTAKPGRMVWK